jgi:hypothetical protein
MQRFGRSAPAIVLGVWGLALIAIIAIGAYAAVGRVTPGTAGRGSVPQEQGSTGDRASEAEVTLQGLLGSTPSANGETEYTLAVGSSTLTLDAGPAWYWKDKNPLAPFVGKTVTIVGEQAQGSASVDVRSVDGTTIREPGKPPWAGGWKRVGEDHPGWSQEKWDRWQAHLEGKQAQFGLDCWPPGHCKDAAGTPQNPPLPNP